MPKINAKIVNKLARLLIIIGLLGAVISTGLLLNNPQSPTYIKNVSIEPAPSSIKPSDQTAASYNVPPNDPKYIAIPAINIKQAEVIRLGLLRNDQIATPGNIYQTGWYDGSSKPGQAGAMFIYGHVSSWQADGLFYNLKKLQPGDKVIVTRGDNLTYTYQVVSSKVYLYNNVDMNQILTPVTAGQPGLNLMTCTGQVIKGTSEFNQRLVVFTKLI